MSRTTTTHNEITLEFYGGGYDIKHSEHGQIGYVAVPSNRIMMMEIDEEHRHNGYGKTAVSQLVDLLTEEYDTIKTTAIISHEMQSILQSNGFNVAPGDASHWIYHTEDQ